jgi:hypothetical protein
MDRSYLGFSDPANWSLVALQTVNAELVGGAFRIPPQTFVMNRHLVQIGLANPNARWWWNLGGWATAKLVANPVPGSSITPASPILANNRLILGSLNLLEVPKISAPWLLELRFPVWHTQIVLELWQYSGPDVSLFERLDEIDAQISLPVF